MKWAAKLTIQERINQARAKTKALTYHLDEIIRIHENNAYVVYTKTISGQIGRSHAAHAFTTLQNTLLNYELVALCRLWDSSDPAKESILTIADLVEDNNVIAELARVERSNWPDPYDARRGEDRAKRLDKNLRDVLATINKIASSSTFYSLVNMRDKRLAHSLEITRREKNQGPISPLKYGDETKILDQTIPVIDTLYQCINGTHFAFDDARNYSKQTSAAFWKGITVSVLE
jgi:hypothetical protein